MSNPFTPPHRAALLLWAWLALACGRGQDGAGHGEEPPAPPPAVVEQPANPTPATGQDPPPDGEDSMGTARNPATTGTVVPLCDRYIRMVCGCAEKRQSAQLRRACELARQSLPEWQNSHKEEEEELAVTKACQRAFLYIQSTGQCDDVSF